MTTVIEVSTPDAWPTRLSRAVLFPLLIGRGAWSLDRLLQTR